MNLYLIRIIRLGLIIFILSELCMVNQASLSLNEEEFNNQHKAARWKKRYRRSLDDLEANDLIMEGNYSSACSTGIDPITNATSLDNFHELGSVIGSLSVELYQGPGKAFMSEM